MTYDVTITAIPTNGTVEDGQSTTLYFAKAAPQVGTVSAPAISISPSGEQDGVYYVDSDFTISWSAEGDVAGYHLYFTDALRTTPTARWTTRRCPTRRSSWWTA